MDEEHTPEKPYCDKLDCWCTNDSNYHAQITQPLLNDVDPDLYEYALETLAIGA